MPAALKLEGKRFGRLTVIEFSGVIKKNRSFLCECACGTKRVFAGYSLKRGATKSCGCLHREKLHEYLRHVRYGGMSKDDFKASWDADRVNRVGPKTISKQEYMATWKAANQKAILRSRLKRDYGISYDQWLLLVTVQAGACSICDDQFDERYKWKQANVDHCHSSKRVRSLLCSRCNITLGKVQENPSLLRSMINYVELHNGA